MVLRGFLPRAGRCSAFQPAYDIIQLPLNPDEALLCEVDIA